MLFVVVDKLYAVPAYPHKVIVLDANGKEVEIYLRGDENVKYAITLDGYTLLSNAEGWWYAMLDDSGKVIKSEYLLVSGECESAELKNFKSKCPKGLVPMRESDFKINKASGIIKSVPREPVVGERRALVILMQYQDVKFKKTKEDFEALFNALDYNDNGAKGSVRDYYLFASQGQLDYISDIFGPYTSKHPMRYYGANSYNSGNDMKPLELCIEAIKSLPAGIDYSYYDNDNDGFVDNVHIIFAGYGEEAGGASDAIWSHEFSYRIALENEVGYSFAGYSCTPELSGNRGTNITNIGVICHELGHALGAMDYYDTNYETGGEYVGTGCWDIMAGGSWNDDGRTPPNFNPYVRCHVFGWNPLVNLTNDQGITMPKMEIGNSQETVVYKMETGDSNDYFLLENRQKCGFDEALPGQGLMIYHVHPDVDRYNNTNTVNATHPQGLYPVCASYSEPSVGQYGNINSSGCPFPGIENTRSFSSKSSPAALAWDDSPALLVISDIAISADGSIFFTTNNDTIIDNDDTDISKEMSVVYNESFETDVGDRISISSIMGKEVWMQYNKGVFVMNGDYLPEATDGKGIFMLFSGRNAFVSESEAIGPDIEIEPGHNYLISFDVYCSSVSASPIPYFNLLVEDDEYGEYKIYTLNEVTEGWNSVEIPLSFVGNKFRYKLYGRVYAGSVCVDNIKLYKEDCITSNECGIFPERGDKVIVYRLDGTCLGEYANCAPLQRGVYVVYMGGQVKKMLILK